MIHELPAPHYGATHVRIDEVVFTVPGQTQFIRGAYGTLDGESFVASPHLAPANEVVTGEEYTAAVTPLMQAFAEHILPLIDARGWGQVAA